MAFPDYGPISAIAEFTQNGFAQGSFIFQLFAGEAANTQALHFIGLLFAMIGAIAIVFLRQFHNAKTIISWTFLVLILLVGPRLSKHFFIEADVNFDVSVLRVDPNNPPTIYLYTPQAIIVDFMSKMHRAIYLAFFDISDPNNPRSYNMFEDAISGGVAGVVNPGLTERPDIMLEMQGYHFIKCGATMAELASPLYEQTWENNLMVLKAAYPEFGIKNNMITIENTIKKQNHYFNLDDTRALIGLYGSAYMNSGNTAYPQFAIFSESPSDVSQTLFESGVSSDSINKAIEKYTSTDFQNLENELNELTYAMMTRGNLVADIGDPSLFESIITPTLTNATSAIYLKKENGNGKVMAFNDISYLFDDGVLNDPAEARISNENDSTFLHSFQFGNQLAASSSILNPGAFAIGKLIQTVADAIPSEDKSWETHVNKADRLTVPVSLGYITPPMREIYRKRFTEPGIGQDSRDITGLFNDHLLNIVSTCAQLHNMIRNHVRDALIFQNTWPNHNTAIVYGDNSTQTTGRIGKINGFDPMVSGTGINYSNYPYKTSNNFKLNRQMIGINATVQPLARSFFYTDQNAAQANQRKVDLLTINTTETNATRSTKNIAAEMLRRQVLSMLMSSGANIVNMKRISNKGNTNIDFVANTETENKTLRGVSNNAMNTSFDGYGITMNIDNMGSNLSTIAKWISEIGVAVTSQFVGVGAVAYIKFLKVFLGIAIFFILMCTPILYMMGLIVPAHAPGVIVTSLIVVLALKAVPIGFTLVDAVISNTMTIYKELNWLDIDKAIMLYVAAAAYTSTTMITFFLIFKAGDTAAVMGHISGLDKQANDVADVGATIAKSLAGAAAMAVTAGVGGVVGGAVAGKGAGAALKAGGGQALEIFGRKGLASIPGAGNVSQEIFGSYREGKGEATVRGDVNEDNKHRLARGQEELSYSQRKGLAADKTAFDKYNSPIEAAANYEQSQKAHDRGVKAAGGEQNLSNIQHANRETQAMSNINSDLGAGIKNLELNAERVDATGVTIEPDSPDYKDAMNLSTYRAMEDAKDSAKFEKQYPAQLERSREFAQQRELNAILSEIEDDTQSALANVTGKVKNSNPIGEQTITTTDKDGKQTSKKIFQEKIYDESGDQQIKRFAREGHPIAKIDRKIRKKASENTAAIELEAMEKGERKGKLTFTNKTTEVLGEKRMAELQAATDPGKLIITPNDPAYKRLKASMKTQGRNVGEGHYISLFEEHMMHNKDARKATIDKANEIQTKIDRVKAHS